MKKSFFTLLLLINIFFSQAQPLHSFFVIHCDPGYATPIYWNTLTKMIDSANYYNVPLTLEFSPQWVNMILSDQNKITRVRSWQQAGHEVAGHHHGIYHCMWDSLTNYPIDSIEANQPVYTQDANGNWVANCDSGILKSPMQPFFDSLDVIAGDSLLLTWGASDEHPEVDLYPDLLYRTTGGRDSAAQGFSNPYTETYGPTTLSNGTYGPYTVCLINYFFIDDNTSLTEMQNKYNDLSFSSQYKVAGVVTHVFNVKNQNQNNPNNFFYQWLRFISGKGCKNVRDIMRAEGCIPQTTTAENDVSGNIDVKIYPNPSDGNITIKQSHPANIQVTIWALDGKRVFHKQYYNTLNNIDLHFIPDGIYSIHISTPEKTVRQKIVIAKGHRNPF